MILHIFVKVASSQDLREDVSALMGPPLGAQKFNQQNIVAFSGCCFCCCVN